MSLNHIHVLLVTHPDSEFADGVVSQCLLLCDGDLEWAEGLAASVLPVLVALVLARLLQVGDHHDGWTPLLPHQTPEINHCLG